MKACVIGLDIGTGSVKAVAVNETGVVIDHIQKPIETYHTQRGYSEQQPEEIWQGVVACLNDLCKKINRQPDVISFSAAMHGLLAVDEKGNAITPFIIWSDARCASIAEDLKNTEEGRNFYFNTGTPIHAMSPLCKIKWLKENEPSLFAQTKKFISIKEYLWWKLFGVYEIDYSIASATGLFDIKKLMWFREALKWAGIDATRLSQPVAPTYFRQQIIKSASGELPISAHTKFMIGASDGCLANMGSFATKQGTAAVTIGSSGAVRVLSKQPILHFPSMPFSYLLHADTFICGGAINNGGLILQWMLKFFLEKEVPVESDYTALFDRIESVQPGAEGLIFLPYLTGERAPVWDAKSCGVFFGLNIQHTQSHMMRAVVEGVCFAIYDVLQMVSADRIPIQELQVSGGFTHSKTWLQIMADVTAKNINIVQTEDASAMGAAYMALETLSFKISPPSHVASIQPCLENHLVYQQNFSIYKSLYPSLSQAMHLLYHRNH